VGKLKCEDFDKLLHLYLDGELQGKELKEIEEHVLSCQRCAAKLQELDNLKAAAKRVKMPQPSGFYWKTFTEKVRNKIILRRKKSFWVRLKSGWELFFYYSPVKLRIAAGIASVLLVFIIGKLYWDYRGKEFERIQSERMERVMSTPAQKKPESTTLTTPESLQLKDQTKELTLLKPKIPAPEEKEKNGKPVETAQNVLKTQVGFVIKDSTSNSLHIRGGRAGEVDYIVNTPESTAKEVTESGSMQKPPLQAQKSLVEKSSILMTAEQIKKGISVVNGIKYYKVDGTSIKALTEQDTSQSVDTLKKVMTSWKEYLKKNPELEWRIEGYSQLTIAYQLLYLKTKNQALLKEGIELLNKYKESEADQKIKDELSKNIEKLEALKKK
jgi:hypothetical protein